MERPEHIYSHWILIIVLAENGVTNFKTIILNYVRISHRTSFQFNKDICEQGWQDTHRTLAQDNNYSNEPNIFELTVTNFSIRADMSIENLKIHFSLLTCIINADYVLLASYCKVRYTTCIRMYTYKRNYWLHRVCWNGGMVWSAEWLDSQFGLLCNLISSSLSSVAGYNRSSW